MLKKTPTNTKDVFVCLQQEVTRSNAQVKQQADRGE